MSSPSARANGSEKLGTRGRLITSFAAAIPLLVLGACDLGVEPVVYEGVGGLNAVADLDNDGAADVLAADCTDYWSLQGDGAGSLVPGTRTGGACAEELDFGDVNADGIVDRLARAENVPTLEIVVGDGSGGFGPPSWFGVPRDSVGADALGDFDADGDDDIVYHVHYQERGASGYEVLLSDGDGRSFTQRGFFSDGAPPRRYIANGLLADDLDSDGDLDLVSTGVVDGYVGIVSVTLGDGTGAFASPQSVVVTFGQDAYTGSVAVTDLDEDGHLDVVTLARSIDPFTGSLERCLAVLAGDGLGHVGPRRCVDHGGTPERILNDGEAADVDGDDHADLITNSGVLFGDGSGSFPRRRSLAAGADAGAVDFDGDGALDVVTSDASRPGRPPRVRVFLNRL